MLATQQRIEAKLDRALERIDDLEKKFGGSRGCMGSRKPRIAQRSITLEEFLIFGDAVKAEPTLETEITWAFAEHITTGQPFGAADLINTGRVIRLSTYSSQFVRWPEVGFMTWLRCSDFHYDMIKRGKMADMIGRPEYWWQDGPNLIVTECVDLAGGYAAKQLLALRKLPGIKRIGAFRAGKWHEKRRNN